MSYFEIAMLVCFGIAWPFSIYRSFVSRSTKGKSAVFLIIVIIGYASGILHKIMYSFDGVIWFYAVNMFMVIIDAALYYRNRRIEKC
jgi:hypothetical protein